MKSRAFVTAALAVLTLLATLALPLLLLSCEDKRNEPATKSPVEPSAASQPAPANAAEADKLLEEMSKETIRLRQRLIELNGKTNVITEERDRLAEEESVKATRRNANYASWLAGFGFFASVVAYFLLVGYAPWIGKFCIGGACGALAVLILARVVSWLAPYLLIIGCCLTGAGVLVLVIYLWRAQKANKKVVELYEDVKPMVDKVIGKDARIRKQVAKLGTQNKFVETLRRKAGLTK